MAYRNTVHKIDLPQAWQLSYRMNAKNPRQCLGDFLLPILNLHDPRTTGTQKRSPLNLLKSTQKRFCGISRSQTQTDGLSQHGTQKHLHQTW